MSRSDRRVNKTKHALMQAMTELIQEKGFEATNISEITERADVGRSTFYAHFADKEDLLQGSIQEGMRKELEERIRITWQSDSSDTPPALAFVLPMLEHADSQRDVFAAMFGKPCGTFLVDLAHDLWADLIRDNWPGADELAVQSVVGAFGSVLTWWLVKYPELSAKEVNQRFCNLMQPLFRQPINAADTPPKQTPLHPKTTGTV